jgi:hypothetical protein
MTKLIHAFNKSLQVGGDGERLIEEYMKTIPAISNVENVSGVAEYRVKDIDFIITTHENDKLAYELKTEPTANKTGNFFYEYTCNVEKNTPGCFMFSEADYWMTFIPQSGMLYVFPLLDYREYVLQAAKNSRMLNVYNQGKLTQGKVLKISQVCDEMKHNAKNIRDYADYEYIEKPSEFRNVVWKSII